MNEYFQESLIKLLSWPVVLVWSIIGLYIWLCCLNKRYLTNDSIFDGDFIDREENDVFYSWRMKYDEDDSTYKEMVETMHNMILEQEYIVISPNKIRFTTYGMTLQELSLLYRYFLHRHQRRVRSVRSFPVCCAPMNKKYITVCFEDNNIPTKTVDP